MAAANDVLSLFKVTADTNEAKAPIADLGGVFGSLFGQIAAGTAVGGGALQIFNGLVGAIQGVGAAAAGMIGDAIAMNASLETTTLQFETLMGSADLARDHVKFLFEFAKNTPFETQPIIEASRQFQVFGGNLLNTEKNLTLVGNAAAATSKPINEIAMWTGRLYSALQSGRPFGEAAARLQELAVLSPTVRGELEAMQKAGKSGTEIFEKYQTALEGFGGAMEKQATSFAGLQSTLSDTISILGAQLFEPFFAMAKSGLTMITDLLGSEGVGTAIKNFGEAGMLAFDAIGAAIGPVIQGLIDTSKEWLGSADSAGIAERAAQAAVHMFAELTSAAAAGLRASGEVLALLQSMAGALAPAFTFIIASFQSWNKAQLDTLSSMELFIGGMLLQLARLTDGLAAVSFGPMSSTFKAAADGLRAEAASLGDSVVGRLQSNYEGFGGTLRKVASDLDAAAAQMHVNADGIRMFEFVGPLMKDMGDSAKKAGDDVAAGGKKAEDAAKKLKAISDSLFSRDVIAKANDYAKALGDIGNISNLTADKKKELNRIVTEGIAAYTALGRTVPPILDQIRIKTQELIPVTHQWLFVELKGGVEQVTPVVAAFQQSVRSLGVDGIEFVSTKVHASVLGFVEYKEAIEDVEPVIEKQIALTREYGRDMLNVVGAFAQFGEMTGNDALAAFMDEVGQSMAVAEQATNDLESAFQSFESGDWAKGIMDGIAGVMAAISAMEQATDQPGRGRRALAGGMTGATIGAQYGGWYGAVAGFIVGAIIGALRDPPFENLMERVGEQWGVSISEGLARAIQEQAETLFGGDQHTAEIFNIGAILAEQGGLDSSNLEMFTARLRDVFVMFAEGRFTIEQAGAVLDENWNAFVEAGTDSNGRLSDSLLEIMRLARETGIEVAAINEYMRGQSDVVVDGFNSIASTLPTESWEGFRENINDARADLDAFEDEEQERAANANARRQQLLQTLGAGMAADQDGGKSLERAAALREVREELAALDVEQANASAASMARRAELAAILTAAEGEQTEAAERNRQALSDMGVIAMSAYGAAIAAGASHVEALRAAQPGLQALRESYEALGLEVEDTFLEALLAEERMMTNNPELMAGIAGLASSFVALHNMGRLNEETFAAMQRTGEAMYTRLQASAAEAGGSTRDALLPMQDYLHEAERAAEELGVPLDDATQSMIAQSRELGIWQDEGPDAAEKTQAAMEELTKAIGDLTDALTGGGDQVDELGNRTRANEDVWRHWADTASAEIQRVRDQVDGLTFGDSPGGMKEWRPMLLGSVAAFRTVDQVGSRALAHLRREVDSMGSFGMSPIRLPELGPTPAERRITSELSTIRDLLPQLGTKAQIFINGSLIHEGDLEGVVDKQIGALTLNAVERGGVLGAQFGELVRSHVR